MQTAALFVFYPLHKNIYRGYVSWNEKEQGDFRLGKELGKYFDIRRLT